MLLTGHGCFCPTDPTSSVCLSSWRSSAFDPCYDPGVGSDHEGGDPGVERPSQEAWSRSGAGGGLLMGQVNGDLMHLTYLQYGKIAEFIHK